MKQITIQLKKHLALTLILIVAFVIRIVFISEIPPGLAHDEIHDILNAQSIAKTGQQIPGILTGVIGNPAGDYQTGIFSELGSYMLVPWVFFFDITWPYIKLPFIFSSLGIVIFLYLIAKLIINQKIALITAFVAAVNPWSVGFGRTAFESLFSFFFYLLAIYLILKLNGWKIIYAIPPLLVGFLTYFSAKPQLIPLSILGILIVKILKPNQSLKPVVILNVCIFLFMIVYALALFNSPAMLRLGEISSNTSYQTNVNIHRTQSLDFPLVQITENKYIEQFRERASAGLGVLSPNFLFVEGHAGGAEALLVSGHGPMYAIDIVLIFLGLIFLARYHLKPLTILIGLCMVSIIPGFVNLFGRSYILRDGLLFPFLIILSASGIYSIYNLIAKIKYRFPIILLGVIYLFSIFYFYYQYAYRTPIVHAAGWFLQERILANYLKQVNVNYPQQKVTVVTIEAKEAAYEYLYFTNQYTNSSQINKANTTLADLTYLFGQVNFTRQCPNKFDSNQTYLIDSRMECSQKGNPSIASPKDGGTLFSIVNDRMCSKYQLRRYPLIKKMEDLKIEDQSAEHFCQTWITNPD